MTNHLKAAAITVGFFGVVIAIVVLPKVFAVAAAALAAVLLIGAVYYIAYDTFAH